MSDYVVVKEVDEFPDYGLSRDGRAWSKKRSSQWKELRQTREYQGPGYRMVVFRVSGRQRKVFLHSLMLKVFVGPRPTLKHQARHMDGDITNNHIDNLAWGTPLDNHADKKRHGTTASGSQHPMAKLTESDVEAIMTYCRVGISGRWIAEAFGVTPATVSTIRTRRNWTHVEQQTFPRLRVREGVHQEAGGQP